jgi:class 3 adenylate cyclase
MDIEAWLQGLGLERYAPAFGDNEIDWEVLPKLTSEDLREIGVAAVGHRRKLLGAIAALGASAPIAAVTAAVSGGSAPADAERRQLTVMFCDLVGSTPLSVRFDPEDLREIVGAYHRCVADTVGRFAGFVAKYMGDGVLIYFGYPEAHEDNTERAVRAGLAVSSEPTALLYGAENRGASIPAWPSSTPIWSRTASPSRSRSMPATASATAAVRAGSRARRRARAYGSRS